MEIYADRQRSKSRPSGNCHILRNHNVHVLFSSIDRQVESYFVVHLLLGLEVVEQDATLLRLLTPVLDDNARAVDNLAGVSFAVDLA